MALETSYTSRSAGSPGGGPTASDDGGDKYWPLSKLKRAYTDYLHSKRREIDEQIDARRYYHGSQYTDEQIKILMRRKQPIMTYNRISRKLNAVVGQLERLKQDPKAYARTPQHEEGAELATAVVRFVLDENEWGAITHMSSLFGAIDGIGGVEMDLKQGDKGDPDIQLTDIDPEAFFYDPRSKRADFSDAMYMGVSKKMDEDLAREKAGDVELIYDSGDDLSKNSDWDNKWFSQEGNRKQIRMVECWYRHKGKWCWSLFTGAQIVNEGESPFKDEDGKSIGKYLMFSGNVDQEGDRYGFVRNLKSPQDGINARQSKMQHSLNSKRLIISQGAVQDVEIARKEWNRHDGIIMVNGPVNEGAKADDQSFDFAGWSKMYEQSVAEIEQYGVNTLGLQEGDQGKSGRAIALLQQAGIAELGPYILSYRGWKVRVYRAIWNAVQQHWQSERWVRVTDDENLAQYLSINKVEIDPQTMQPTIVNAIGSLDVDIILDEGPDTVTLMEDTFETLSNMLPAIAPITPPNVLAALVSAFIQVSPLPASSKKAVRDAQQQAEQQGPPPDPELQKAQMQSQIAAEKNAQDIQLRREQAMADAQLKREVAESDLQLEQQKMMLQARQQQEQAQFDMAAQRDKSEFDFAAQRQKTELDMDGQRQKYDLDREERQMKMDHEAKMAEITINCEQDKTSAKTGAPTTANIKAFEEIAQGFKEGMALIAEAMTAPKKIAVQRDNSGKVTGATAS